jgi:hypothetical protein
MTETSRRDATLEVPGFPCADVFVATRSGSDQFWRTMRWEPPGSDRSPSRPDGARGALLVTSCARPATPFLAETAISRYQKPMIAGAPGARDRHVSTMLPGRCLRHDHRLHRPEAEDRRRARRSPMASPI